MLGGPLGTALVQRALNEERYWQGFQRMPSGKPGEVALVETKGLGAFLFARVLAICSIRQKSRDLKVDPP